MVKRAEAIQRFLDQSTISDLARLYNLNMECQVNVAQDGGERVEGDYKGRTWSGWTDGLTTWKPFRIPWKAMTEPDYLDSDITWDLAIHAEAIGLTGWDWKHKLSRWVAFDFDSIMGHSTGLTNEELETIIQTLKDIPWTTIRKSTSGKGIHVYIFLNPVSTINHIEHAALARAILGKMSALSGYNFQSKVDACGGIMWFWHRKMKGTDGLTLLKQGTILEDVPPNWKDHLQVITGKRRKNLPQQIEEAGLTESFEELTGQRPKIPLDADHKKLINYLKDNNVTWWWDSDHHMLVTHSVHLQRAHDELGFKGFFKTNSPGTDLNTPNSYMFPMRHGAWSVKRYTPGIQEHSSWIQDGRGLTSCYLNRDPDLGTVCRALGGLEDPSGGFIFREAEIAVKAAAYMGVTIDVATGLLGRETKLKQHKDGRLIVEVNRSSNDTAMEDWLSKKNGPWTRIYNAQVSSPNEPDISNYDDMIRHVVSISNDDFGWTIKSENEWRQEPFGHLKVALGSLGLSNKEITAILGSSVLRCWKLVNKPFQPEYCGEREWNRFAAQFRFLPTKDLDNLHYPTWLRILTHCGSGLDDAIKNNPWCIVNGILSGSDYLMCWIASLFQYPMEPLPYLFFYGQENTGKSIFHEALSLLLTKGYMRADAALINQSGFNGELAGAILAVVEETDMRNNRQAKNRIKDLVTSREILIHEKNNTPYHLPNSLHFVQCSNDHQALPVFTGDTRITVSYVKELDPAELIPKRDMITLLEKEAPDFLAAVLNLELPKSNDRLNIPVVNTSDKAILQKLNETPLETFVSEYCQYQDGSTIKMSDFYDRFISSINPNESKFWSKVRVGREMPPQYPKGRRHKDAQFYIGNIAWAGSPIEEEPKKRLILKGEFLDECE